MKVISAKEVEMALNAGQQLNLVDVREVDEVEQEKIPGIVNIPLSELENRKAELDKTKAYILVCRSGNRSGIACQMLENEGYDVANMSGGMLDWEGPVE
ncbi:rhodanese-like domain-containing protein [Bacillus kwashiorkori]|uniref:rhodanese-like domain-containing protein n=1 Tax=Bacillus kwashiorkori TaxID=1522318 RepID=UPI0007851F13|nr:rhodanese-like domain-containing protein [Bacillus kwashiorkori]